MALNIKDAETGRLSRDLARLAGESVTQAVKIALGERLARERRRRGKTIDWSGLREKQEEMARIPIVDDRTSDVLLDYDDGGLPR